MNILGNVRGTFAEVYNTMVMQQIGNATFVSEL